MANAQVATTNQKGKKLSFADWISIVGREETPFLSMIGKQSVSNTKFQWQQEALQEPAGKADDYKPIVEGSDAAQEDAQPTTELSNITQIFRRVVSVTDTANKQALYGKATDLRWQTRMRGIELRRDVEWAYLNNGEAVGENTDTRQTGGFTAKVNCANVDDATWAGDDTFEAAIQKAGQTLFEKGGRPSVLLVHPSMSLVISALQQKQSERLRIFNNEKSVITEVNSFTTSLGQTLRVVYDVLMPEDAAYIFAPGDWTDCVMRDYAITPLAKTGSSQRMMMETERGLRSRNPSYSVALKKAGGEDVK